MCRYRYKEKKCAHPKNMTIECVGEERCRFRTELKGKMEIDDISLTNIDNEEEEGKCPNTTCGIYCKKYNRFYCAGDDNCQTEEDFLHHLNMYGGVE